MALSKVMVHLQPFSPLCSATKTKAEALGQQAHSQPVPCHAYPGQQLRVMRAPPNSAGQNCSADGRFSLASSPSAAGCSSARAAPPLNESGTTPQQSAIVTRNEVDRCLPFCDTALHAAQQTASEMT